MANTHGSIIVAKDDHGCRDDWQEDASRLGGSLVITTSAKSLPMVILVDLGAGASIDLTTLTGYLEMKQAMDKVPGA